MGSLRWLNISSLVRWKGVWLLLKVSYPSKAEPRVQLVSPGPQRQSSHHH